MRCELLDHRLVLPIVAGFLFAASTAAAQDAAPVPAARECFPECRSGYLCHEGVCITGCNPPCGDDEKCTVEGECVAKASTPPSPPPVLVSPAPPVEPPPQPVPPPAPQGVALGFTLGATTCATPNEHGCRTADGDAGIYTSIRGGYRFFQWLIVDADASFMPVFLKDDPNAKAGLQFAVGAGARFFPLERRHGADLVLGLHAGYFLSFVKNNDDAPSAIDKTMQHAVYLAYEVGVEFNLRPDFSLGLMLDVFEPFQVKTCSSTAAVPATYGVNPTEDGGEIVETAAGVPAYDSCSKYSGDYDLLFFGAGLSGSFLL